MINETRSPFGMKILAAALILLFFLSVGALNYTNYLMGSSAWDLVISAVLLSIPIGLFFFCIWVLAAASLQRHQHQQMSTRLTSFIYWTPRIAGILIALFVAMFALDVFDGQASIWMMIGGFFIHALPGIIMGGVVALAWRKPVIGFVVFLLSAVFFLRTVIRAPFQDSLGMLLLFSGPMAMIATLFWANWRWHIQRNPASAAGLK